MKIEGKSCIYKITNPVGGIYIGCTKDTMYRFSKYKNLHCKEQKLLYKSLICYGWENHNVEILIWVDNSLKSETEKEYVSKYNSYCKDNDKGLNSTRGGKGGRSEGWIPSQETREKWRVINTGRKWTEQQRVNWLEARKKLNWKPSQHQREIIRKRSSKPVLQISIEGIIIKEWESIAEVVRTTGYGKKYISNCCYKRQEKYKKCIWRFKNVVNEEN